MSEINELEIFAEGSKSFSLAARFFPHHLRLGAAQVYHWCRHVDDAIDEGKGDLHSLRLKTQSVWQHSLNLTPPFVSLREATQRFNIPDTYALDMLEGMRLDVENSRYQTLKDLEFYCYCVASTVGLMMCHVMGVFKESALKEAAALGVAMQMTNIARDVKEDFHRGRVYLPLSWLNDEGISQEMLFASKTKLFQVVKRLIHVSEAHYKIGRSGIIHLPMQGALAVTIASLFYREIGREILRRGESALDTRVVVSLPKKMVLIFLGVWELGMSLPARIFHSRKLVPIKSVWRPV